jgi:hypothetical protein
MPAGIKKARELKHDQVMSAKNKERRVRAHSKPGKVPFKNAKTLAIVREDQ